MADQKETTGTRSGGSGVRKSPRAAGTEVGKGEGKAVAKPPKSGRGAAAAKPTGKARGANLKKDLRDFASARPEGWNHDDWLGFLESLQSRGHNIRDREAIGVALEKERLDLALSGVKGVGPQRRSALIEKYGTLWALRNADPGEIARAGNMPRSLAEKVKSEMR